MMAHPSSSPSCNGSAGVHSSPTVSKALPSVISGAGVQLQNNRSAGHHVQWSDPLVYTRGIPAREFQGSNPVLAVASSITSNYSSQHDTRTIAGAMEGLHLAPAVSNASTTASLHSQLISTSQAARQGSFITAPMNPNLRFIYLHRLQALQANGPLNPIDSGVIDDRSATTGNVNMPLAISD
jgi:hypothetical protein